MVAWLLNVHLPIIHPVQAIPGDVIVVCPGHPTAPLCVMRQSAGKWRSVRVGPPNYGALLIPLLDGVLSELTPGVRQVLVA
jgi:hypothetical protein